MVKHMTLQRCTILCNDEGGKCTRKRDRFQSERKKRHMRGPFVKAGCVISFKLKLNIHSQQQSLHTFGL